MTDVYFTRNDSRLSHRLLKADALPLICEDRCIAIREGEKRGRDANKAGSLLEQIHETTIHPTIVIRSSITSPATMAVRT
jgi:hypothetical protein